MLNKRTTINISGSSVIDGVEAMTLHATIEEGKPEDMNINYYQANRSVYKANREICRADQVEFEEYVYALQDKLLAEIGGTENETEQ